MTTITFDTLKRVDRLKSAGVPPEQAEAVVRVIAELQDELVTREQLVSTLTAELALIKTELPVLKWMSGVVIGGIVALIIKAFLG